MFIATTISTLEILKLLVYILNLFSMPIDVLQTVFKEYLRLFYISILLVSNLFSYRHSNKNQRIDN